MSGRYSDPYVVLGVPREASATDITRAYKRAARTTHPDTHPGDPSAAERFRDVTTAYETLSDPRRRAAHDRAHPAASPLRHTTPTVRTIHLGAFPPTPLDGRALWAGPVHIAPADTPPHAPAIGDDVFELVDAISRRLWARRFPF